MPLIGKRDAPIRSQSIPSGWSFLMRDEHGTDVRVIVTDLALDAIDPAKLSLDAFQAHRAEVERLASDKYTGGISRKTAQ